MLDLTRIPEANQTQAKREAGEFVVGEILRFVGRGQSPVEGESFPRLNSDYADEFKGGNRTPNLDLNGNMLDSLSYEVTATGIDVGIFKDSQEAKADGHNNFSGDSALPKRRFIPASNQSFKRVITEGVNQILDGYRVDDQGASVLQLNNDFLVTPSRSLVSAEGITIEQVISGLTGSLFE